MKIIAKIESTQGVRNLEEILDVSDGVMIARGDLGVEVPLEEVPVIQKHAIRIARKMGKTVVTATQMLDSMMRNPRPTRAEATDVANAIYDGTTAIMLSGETAAGSYPEAAVRTMSRIAECAEKDIDWAGMLKKMDLTEKANYTPAIAHAACMIAEDIGATAIITVSLSGFTARALSQFRPTCPVIACAPDMQIACQSNLMFGVQPLIIGREKELDRLLDTAVERSKYAGYVRTGDRVIVTAGMHGRRRQDEHDPRRGSRLKNASEAGTHGTRASRRVRTVLYRSCSEQILLPGFRRKDFLRICLVTASGKC